MLFVLGLLPVMSVGSQIGGGGDRGEGAAGGGGSPRRVSGEQEAVMWGFGLVGSMNFYIGLNTVYHLLLLKKERARTSAPVGVRGIIICNPFCICNDFIPINFVPLHNYPIDF